MKGSLARHRKGGGLIFCFILFVAAFPAQAGMVVYDLTDVARMRLEDISFFGFLLLGAALGVRLLWNYLAKDFTRLPRLSYFKALCLTGLLSMAMLLILVMISGARELLTPGAWTRQTSHYRLNDVGNDEMRQQCLNGLRSALLQYAQGHDGNYPPHDYVPEIPARLWEAPDSAGTRYVYVNGLSTTNTNAVLAFEPPNFGENRWVLFADGRVETVKAAEIRRMMEKNQGQ
ncbi:MAG TPA: hypothetical protein VFC07_15420 [Verrucomicrobiae bacterium]|nr:hypothetical protein [Verrucomicrobiae bacterium]